MARANEDPGTEVAKNRFAAGQKLYAESNYAAALKEFQEANIAKPLPAFQYNIARCYQRLGEWAKAADAYRQYLAAKPNDVEAQKNLAQMEANEKEHERVVAERLANPSGATAAHEAPLPDAGDSQLMEVNFDDNGGSSKKWWIVGGVVAGVVVVGAVVAAVLLAGGQQNAPLEPNAVMINWH